MNLLALSPPSDDSLEVIMQWGFLVFGAVFILVFLVKIGLDFWKED